MAVIHIDEAEVMEHHVGLEGRWAEQSCGTKSFGKRIPNDTESGGMILLSEATDTDEREHQCIIRDEPCASLRVMLVNKFMSITLDRS